MRIKKRSFVKDKNELYTASMPTKTGGFFNHEGAFAVIKSQEKHGFNMISKEKKTLAHRSCRCLPAFGLQSKDLSCIQKQTRSHPTHKIT